ncbi:hypothetical protein DPMN_086213 [Dreissena polymorpha]|uniref:Uncharacterized protein n=1 Tax=Dreissena polymorpha TaxID=45954 RepID=A0A9D3YF33_DREPO|nr:hypothetical protein DPMN_086213 [Dreissena polymorpha]
MASAIRRSLPKDVDHGALALHQSTSDHKAPAILRSLSGDVTGHDMTGPVIGQRGPVRSPVHGNGHRSWHRSPVRRSRSSSSDFSSSSWSSKDSSSSTSCHHRYNRIDIGHALLH